MPTRHRSLLIVGLFVALVTIWYVVAPPVRGLKVPVPNTGETTFAPEHPEAAAP